METEADFFNTVGRFLPVAKDMERASIYFSLLRPLLLRRMLLALRFLLRQRLRLLLRLMR